MLPGQTVLSEGHIAEVFERSWAALSLAPDLQKSTTGSFLGSAVTASVLLRGRQMFDVQVVLSSGLTDSMAAAALPSSGFASNCASSSLWAVDVVGELANQLAGGVKGFLGQDLSLTVPSCALVDSWRPEPECVLACWSTSAGRVCASVAPVQ